MQPRSKLVVLSLPLLLVNLPIALTAIRHDPIPIGSSAEFWEYLCGVELRGFSGHHRYSDWGGIYPTTDGWLIYWGQTHHEQLVNRVHPREAAADLPEVIELSESTECGRWFLAHREGSTPERLVQDLAAARLTESGGGPLSDHEGFAERWRRAQRVWMNYVFESLYLSGWILFAAWPWLRSASPSRWAMHWFVWPLLLFLPYYLGYAPFTFTFGPTGGFVYPLVLMLFSIPVIWIPGTGIDAFIPQNLPQPLAALSQSIGPAMAMSFMGFVGPVGLLGYGAVLGGVVYGLRRLVERRVRS